MKKIIITSVLAAMPLFGFSQTTAFDKFQNVEGIESICLNKKLFDLAGSVETSAGSEKTQKCLDMVKNLDNLKIFTTSEKKYIKALRNTVTSYLKDNALEEVISVNDDDSKVKVYVKSGDTSSKIKEALLFVEDDKELVVMTFTGAIDLKKLKDIQ